jgi:HK97 family phage portal protein
MGTVIDILRGKVNAGDLSSMRQRASMSKPASFTGRGRQALQLDPQATNYSASAIAYRCVHKTAANLASVDLTVLRGDQANSLHPIAELWNRRPNPVLSARAQKELVYARLELTGEQMIYVDRGETGLGEPTAFWPIWDPVEVVVDERMAGELLGFVVKVRGGKRVPLLPSEVLWLRYPHPFEQWGALAPWKAALYATESDAYARAWQKGEFEHGARPSHVIFLGDLDEEQHNRAVAEFRTQVEGPQNAGKSLLVSGETTGDVERLTLTPAEMSYMESRARNAEEVALAFGYRVDSLLGGSTYENQRAAKTADWSDLYVPKLEVLASETDRQLLPNVDETCAFDLSEVEALRENQDSIYNRIRGIAYTDTLLIDEMREQLGYEPLPGGLGQVTLTEFRSRINVDATKELTALTSGERSLRVRARLYVTGRGLVRDARNEIPVQRGKPKPLSEAKILKTYDRHERIGQRAVRKLADKQERVVQRKIKELMRGNGDALWARITPVIDDARIGHTPWSALPVCDARISSDDILDMDYWREQSQELMDSWLSGVWENGGESAARALGVDFDLFDQQVITKMQNRLQVLADSVTKTTRDVLESQLLLSGVEGGESIEQLSKRISAVYDDLRGFRAERIARTETVGGFNAASREGALASGVVTSRTWLATKDTRTRESHNNMNGETLDNLDGAYSNGLMHPGDPSGPSSETINCRCVEIFGVD